VALAKHLPWHRLVRAYVQIRRNDRHISCSGLLDAVMQDSPDRLLTADTTDTTHDTLIIEATEGYESQMDAQDCNQRDCGNFNPIIIYPMP
jgi:hypothetical protein